MMTLIQRCEILGGIAVILVASWPLPATAEEERQGQDRIRVAVMNFENNSSWNFWGDMLGYAAADELVT